MNINTLQDSLEYVAYSGSNISSEQCMVLQNSLTILQTENHFQQTYFWGKIFGTDKDYFIAFGTTKDVLKERIFYYSTNMFDWGLLPKAKKKAKMLTLLCKELFLGDATFRVNVLREDTKETSDALAEATQPPPGKKQPSMTPKSSTTEAPPKSPSQKAPPTTPTDTAQKAQSATAEAPPSGPKSPSQVAPPPTTPADMAKKAEQPTSPVFITESLKEEDRLSAVVALVNDEAAIVPRGALFKRTDGCVVLNSAFKGLPKEEAKFINNYYHYRIPQQRWNINLLTQQDYNYSFDFLDTTDTDIPEGRVWELQFYDAGRVSVLQNLYWPGMTCYHRLDTPHYGFMYTGLGKRNMDLPFMIY